MNRIRYDLHKAKRPLTYAKKDNHPAILFHFFAFRSIAFRVEVKDSYNLIIIGILYFGNQLNVIVIDSLFMPTILNICTYIYIYMFTYS